MADKPGVASANLAYE